MGYTPFFCRERAFAVVRIFRLSKIVSWQISNIPSFDAEVASGGDRDSGYSSSCRYLGARFRVKREVLIDIKILLPKEISEL